MADDPKNERIPLPNNRQTTIAIGFKRGDKSVAEPGDTVRVASSAVTVLSAAFNPETGLVDVVPVDGALGPVDVTVTTTLADGTVLPAKTRSYDVTHPDADALELTDGEIVDKAAAIPLPVPNADPVVIVEPAKPSLAHRLLHPLERTMKYRVVREFTVGDRAFAPDEVVTASDVGADAVAGFVDGGFLVEFAKTDEN